MAAASAHLWGDFRHTDQGHYGKESPCCGPQGALGLADKGGERACLWDERQLAVGARGPVGRDPGGPLCNGYLQGERGKGRPWCSTDTVVA